MNPQLNILIMFGHVVYVNNFPRYHGFRNHFLDSVCTFIRCIEMFDTETDTISTYQNIDILNHHYWVSRDSSSPKMSFVLASYLVNSWALPAHP